MKAERIKRPSAFDPATYDRPLWPSDINKAAEFAKLIDKAMRTQRPELKRIDQ